MYQMRTLLMLILSGSAAMGQYQIPAGRIPESLRRFEAVPGEKELRCEVQPLRPSMTFGFRFQAGYLARVPMSQYRGPGHAWAILVRVTPEGGNPVYLGNRMRLPDVPATKVELEVGGGYLLGEGRYRATWVLYDETGRVCRKEWTIDARRGFHDRSVKLAMEPNTVTSFSRAGARDRRNTDDAPPFRLTILMHAAPMSPRRQRLGGRDTLMLLGTLSSLMERLPAYDVRLVVFNLEQQREIFRQDDFRAERMEQVGQAIEGLQLQTLDYHILQNRKGHVDLLADMVNEELTAAKPPDVVVFLGPLARQVDHFPEQLLAEGQGAAPRFFYLQYRPPFLNMQAVLPDVIHSVVSKLKGKTVIMHTPADFEKGIQQVERAGAANRGPGARGQGPGIGVQGSGIEASGRGPWLGLRPGGDFSERSQLRDSGFGIRDSALRTRDSGFGIWDSGLWTRDSGLGIQVTERGLPAAARRLCVPFAGG
jgi:hypothetical protein